MKNLNLLLTYCLISYTASEFEPAYLKVCSKELKYSIDSYRCEKGVWLKQPIEPGCLCVRGVWALTNGFCDEKAVLIVGDGHCYNIPFEIQSAKLIGDPDDPFKPKLYVAPSSLDSVYEITEDNFTPSILSDSTIIIGINPRRVAQRKDYGLCIDLDTKEYGRPLHVYANPRRTSKEWILDKKMEYYCPSTTEFQHHIAFGEMFSIGSKPLKSTALREHSEKNRIEQKMFVERHCKHECPIEVVTTRVTQNPGNPFKVQSRSLGNHGTSPRMTDPRFKRVPKIEKASTAGDNHFQLGPRPRPKRKKTMEERQKEREELRANATMKLEDYEREVNEQTLRMMHAQISPVLLKIPNPKVVTREYRYFQHIRQVVERTCPEEFVPKHLIKGLMRMFRQLLWETQDTFHHTQTGDESLFNRTLQRLHECARNSEPPSLLFATYNESWSPADNTSAPKPERCPVPIIYAVNGTYYNRTDINYEDPKYLKNYTYLFPTHLKFNASQVDYVIETAWKIVMIGQYRCSRYFDAETAIEFSHLFHQVQSFFNYKIIKRWYYEKSIVTTYDILKMVFPSFDLKKFMFGLDSCLYGSWGFSNFDFKDVWLQRPKFPHTENDLSQDKHVLPGSTSFLDTRDYAPDPTPPSDSRAKRGKREVLGFNLWNDQARCIGDYMEPVTNFDFGYRLPSDCVTPVDPFDTQNSLFTF